MITVQAVETVATVNPFQPLNRLFCRLDGLTTSEREQKRLTALQHMGLMESEMIPVFDEATQTAADFMNAPICLLALMVEDQLIIKAERGLFKLGRMNTLSMTRKLSRLDAFSTYVVDSQQDLVIEDTVNYPCFRGSSLVQHYGIRAYLGTPLITAEGQCIGALAVLDLMPRQFTHKDVEFLALTARWCLREYERDLLLDQRLNGLNPATTYPQEIVLERSAPHLATTPSTDVDHGPFPHPGSSLDAIRLKLLGNLTQELRTPLTSVIGMSSMLRREVYGPLTDKQREYLEIIYASGQQLTALVEELVRLGKLSQDATDLRLSAVDIEMVCQQAKQSLDPIAAQLKHKLRLSVEPGERIWQLDKDKIRQALYYSIFSILESAESGSTIRIHVSRRQQLLSIAIWATNPWFSDGLPQVKYDLDSFCELVESSQGNRGLEPEELEANSRIFLGLLLSRQLAACHGGRLVLQGSPDSGYRYVFELPQMTMPEAIATPESRLQQSKLRIKGLD